MDDETTDRLQQFLEGFMTAERIQRFREILEERTRHVTVVLEDIYQPQNASAVLRTCECLGIQDIHVIEKNHRYELNKDVVRGSNQWITLHRYRKKSDPVKDCIDHLKKSGYTLYATSPHVSGYTPETVPLDKKIAVVMGTEGDGISNEIMQQTDGFIRIPMFGFTESLNISVSAAIILSRIIERMKPSAVNWRLSEHDKKQLLLEWTRKSIKKCDLLISEFFTNYRE